MQKLRTDDETPQAALKRLAGTAHGAVAGKNEAASRKKNQRTRPSKLDGRTEANAASQQQPHGSAGSQAVLPAQEQSSEDRGDNAEQTLALQHRRTQQSDAAESSHIAVGLPLSHRSHLAAPPATDVFPRVCVCCVCCGSGLLVSHRFVCSVCARGHVRHIRSKPTPAGSLTCSRAAAAAAAAHSAQCARQRHARLASSRSRGRRGERV